MNDILKEFTYSSTYRKDFTKRNFKKVVPFIGKQEFEDPISEGFKNYLDVSKKDFKGFEENGDNYLEKIKRSRKKIGKMYFGDLLDHKIIKREQLLDGKSIYQVEYCDIENNIRKRLPQTEQNKFSLPDDWVIPVTTQKYDYRKPTLLSKEALKPPLVLKPMENLGQNENINQILNVKTEDSEYNETIGKLGKFIVEEEMHGAIKRAV